METEDFFPINFVPPRGLILFCDFDVQRVHPEMGKLRRVVVVSPRSYNHRWGNGPGRCLVVPFSATAKLVGLDRRPTWVHFPVGTYQSLPLESHAICDAITLVSHARLSKVWLAHEKSLSEIVSTEDLQRLQLALVHALGCKI